MITKSETQLLVKFLVVSALSFLVGTIHGMLQVMPPIRAWLDSIGSPYGGPGHMIDPLAHAHMNLVGGVVMLAMGVTFYLLPQFSGKRLYSKKLVQYTFWFTVMGVYSFYTILMVFGTWEGYLMLHNRDLLRDVHQHYYSPLMAMSGTCMALGFLFYFLNIVFTLTKSPKVTEATAKENVVRPLHFRA